MIEDVARRVLLGISSPGIRLAFRSAALMCR